MIRITLCTALGSAVVCLVACTTTLQSINPVQGITGVGKPTPKWDPPDVVKNSRHSADRDAQGNTLTFTQGTSCKPDKDGKTYLMDWLVMSTYSTIEKKLVRDTRYILVKGPCASGQQQDTYNLIPKETYEAVIGGDWKQFAFQRQESPAGADHPIEIFKAYLGGPPAAAQQLPGNR